VSAKLASSSSPKHGWVVVYTDPSGKKRDASRPYQVQAAAITLAALFRKSLQGPGHTVDVVFR
jgi:hypothetical protein